MSIEDADERVIEALCELHNAEIEFIVSRVVYFAERNPDMTPEEVIERGRLIEEELEAFKDSIWEIIEGEVAARRRGNQDAEDLHVYPEGSVERMVSDFLGEQEE